MRHVAATGADDYTVQCAEGVVFSALAPHVSQVSAEVSTGQGLAHSDPHVVTQLAWFSVGHQRLRACQVRHLGHQRDGLSRMESISMQCELQPNMRVEQAQLHWAWSILYCTFAAGGV